MEDFVVRLEQYWKHLATDLPKTESKKIAQQLANNAQFIVLQGRFWWEIKRCIPECSADFKSNLQSYTERKEKYFVLKWGCNFMGSDYMDFIKSMENIIKIANNFDLCSNTVYYCSGNSFAAPFSSIGHGIIHDLSFNLKNGNNGDYKVIVDTCFSITDNNLWNQFLSAIQSHKNNWTILPVLFIEKYHPGPWSRFVFFTNRISNYIEREISQTFFNVLQRNGLTYQWPFKCQRKAKRLTWLIESDLIDFSKTFPDWKSDISPAEIALSVEYNVPDFWPETRSVTETDERTVRRDLEDIKRITADVRKVAVKREACLGDMIY